MDLGRATAEMEVMVHLNVDSSVLRRKLEEAARSGVRTVIRPRVVPDEAGIRALRARLESLGEIGLRASVGRREFGPLRARLLAGEPISPEAFGERVKAALEQMIAGVPPEQLAARFPTETYVAALRARLAMLSDSSLTAADAVSRVVGAQREATSAVAAAEDKIREVSQILRGLAGEAGETEAVDSVSEVVEETATGVQSSVMTLREALSPVASLIRDAFSPVLPVIQGIFTPIQRAIGYGFERATGAMVSLAGGIASRLTPVMSTASGVVQAFASRLEPVISPLRRVTSAFQETGRNLSMLASQSRRLKVPEVSFTERAIAQAADVEKMTKGAIAAQIRSALQFLGVKTSSLVIDAAARAVKAGSITIAEAVQAIYTGTKQYRAVLREAGLEATRTAGAVSNLSRALEVARVAAGGSMAEPLLPSTGMRPAGQGLAVAAALEKSTSAATGFMKSLLTLRWEIFTVMFFIYGLTKAAESFFNTLEEGGKVVAAARTALRALSSAGVSDAYRLVAALQDASGGYYTLQEAATRLGALFAGGLPAELMQYAPHLMEIARAVAALRGTDVEEVFKGMTESIVRGEFRMARTHGTLVGNLEDLLAEYKAYVTTTKASGQQLDELTVKTEKLKISQADNTAQLTAQQKQWLILWGIIQRGDRVIRAVGTDFDDVRTASQSARTAIQDLSNEIKGLMALEFAPWLKKTADQLYYIRGLRMAEELFHEKPPMPEVTWYEYQIEQMARRYIEAGMDAKTAFRKAEEEFRQEMIQLGKWAILRSVSGGVQLADVWSDVGVVMKAVGADAMRAAAELSGMGQAASDAKDDLQDLARMRFDALANSLRDAAALTMQWRRQEEDRNIRWRREDEDFQRDLGRRMADAAREAAEARSRATKEYQDKTAEAWADLNRRLAQIDRELARELLSIWRDYNDEMWQAELERDAMAALMAARRRDRRITEANEEAEEERRQAWEQYQDAIENAKRQMEDQLRQIREQYNQRLAEVEEWRKREEESRKIARDRELEDEKLARGRALEDLRRELALKLYEIAINNDKTLTEQQRFQLLALGYLQAYSSDSIEMTEQMLASIANKSSDARIKELSQTGAYFKSLLAMKAQYSRLLGVPIIIPVRFDVQYPPLFGKQPSGWSPPGGGGGKVQPYAIGGTFLANRPTAFIAGERGPEWVTVRPLWIPGRVSGSFEHEVRAVVRAETDMLEARIVNAVTRALQQVF